jgi:4-azaleucine resistance transporter AzlC
MTFTHTIAGADAPAESRAAQMRRGFVRLGVLWPGTILDGAAYAVVSLNAGLSALQILALSVFLYSGAAQFAFTSMAESHAAVVAIVGTVALLNLRHILYGMAIARWLPRDGQPPRPLLAQCLVDESFGVAEAEVNAGHPSGWFLFGAGISMFLSWMVAVCAGLIFTRFVDIPDDAGLDFIFPLSFVALTVPMLRHHRLIVAAVVAAGVTVAVSQVAGSGLTIFAATVSAILDGCVMEPREVVD